MIPKDSIVKQIQKQCPVYYFVSSEQYLAQKAMFETCSLLLGDETEKTVLDEAAPDIESVIMAAGTISFFGTRRLIVMPNLDPSAYSEKDFSDLCDAISSAENAVFVMCSAYSIEWNKPRIPKHTTKLMELCRKIGYVQDIAKLTGEQLRENLIARAASQNTVLPDTAAKALVERSGEDVALLENEVDKLCALSGYQTVSAAMVAQLGTPNLEADVFDMVKLVTAKNSTAACTKLQQLIKLRNEPIAIAAALNGSYIDMYRVKLGQSTKHSFEMVHKDFGYKGSPYRLKYVLDNTKRYTLAQLKECLQILDTLDRDLKSSPVDGEIQMETALCCLCQVGNRL